VPSNIRLTRHASLTLLWTSNIFMATSRGLSGIVEPDIEPEYNTPSRPLRDHRQALQFA
jgi:hypothetical protein